MKAYKYNFPASRNSNQRLSIGLFVLSMFVITSCTTLGPDFETPVSEVEEEWIDIEDPTIKPTSDDYAEWWKAFNDPVLQSLIEKAYQENLTLTNCRTTCT